MLNGFRSALADNLPFQHTVNGLTGVLAGRGRYWRAMKTLSRISAIYGWHLGRHQGRQGVAREQADARVAALLTELCRRNGAFWVKGAQFFSCRPDVLPPAFIQSFQTLQNDAAAVPFEKIVPLLRAAWGADWRNQFRDFEQTPVAVASIAQVHRATLADGQQVAVKVRLPGVKRSFEQDARVFRALAALMAPRFREFDLMQAVEQLLEMTAVELDFRHEAANLQRFARLPHPPRIRVPTLLAALSSEKVLVTGWEPGQRLRNYLDENPKDAADLLGVLLTSYLQQVTRFGLYQADPHPGNFLVNDDKQVVILDYGALGMLAPDQVRRYSRLLYGIMGFAGEVDLGELFVEAGFRGGDPQTLKELALYVLTDRVNQQGPVAAMADLMEKFREQRISIPDSYIGISRVLITLGGFLMSYDVPFDWTPPERRLSPSN